MRDALARTMRMARPASNGNGIVAQRAWITALVAWRPCRGGEASLTESLSLRKSVFGEMNLEVAVALGEYRFGAMGTREILPGAEQAQREALAIRKKLFGEEHTMVANSLNNAWHWYCVTKAISRERRRHNDTPLPLRRNLPDQTTLTRRPFAKISAAILRRHGALYPKMPNCFARRFN